MKKILVYVQHLLGVGHLHRTASITRALTRGHLQVTLVSGGMPEPTIDFGPVDFIQLRPIKTDPAFKALYDDQGRVINEKFKQSRTAELLTIVEQIRPDLVIIETYPFGRRQMRFELLPLLRYLKYGMAYRPLVSSSIRDVIQPKTNHRRTEEVVSIVDEYFDIIFVHGDESFIPFERTFPEAIHFREKLVYSGYVVKSSNIESGYKRKKNTILVSAGGGAVGQQIYQTVVKASLHDHGRHYNWHMLVGNNYPAPEYDQLAEKQHEGLKVERNRSDFLRLLSCCTVSVSQAGYNTIMDLLVTRTPALVIPFEGVSEKEQLIRSKMLAQHNIVNVLREKNITNENMLAALAKVPRIPDYTLDIDLHGDQRMYQLIYQILHF